MLRPGRYVRAPAYESDVESSCESEGSQMPSPGRYVRMMSPDAARDDPYADYRTVIDPDQENRELKERVMELEKTIAEIAATSRRNREDNRNTEGTLNQNSSPGAPACAPTSTPAVMPFRQQFTEHQMGQHQAVSQGYPSKQIVGGLDKILRELRNRGFIVECT